MRPISLPHNANTFLVRDLIDETLAIWREDPICDTFLSMDASVILGILLCTQSIPDFWSWAHEKKGTFIVCSGYRMLVRTKLNREDWIYHTTGSSSLGFEVKE